MKVPLSWLREFVDFEDTAEGLAERLTFAGIEVEDIARIGGDLTNVVTAKVLDVKQHPSADRLKICRVTDDVSEKTVVCGADNAVAGAVVVLAKPGAKLPDGTVIKETSIRGEKSEGMLCAEDEIGLSNDHSGIMILPVDTPLGISAGNALGLPDTVLDLEIVWNRPDCLSILGIAREVAVLYGKKIKMPAIDFVEQKQSASGKLSVKIDDATLCPRYTARYMENIKIEASPLWMQRRLDMCGVRALNNVVDITNYVMLECGHPLHAFDYDLLQGSRIIVRRASDGEKMRTLDGVEHELDADMLVIADSSVPVALAGVMGGEGSEIRDNTERVVLESATFYPPSVKQTSTELNVDTESSHRFERGVDAEMVDWASSRAACLMAKYAGAKIAFGLLDEYPGRKESLRIKCRFQRVRSLLGLDIGGEEICNIFESAFFRVREKNTDACLVEVPSFRLDVEMEIDLIEEVARFHGMDKLPEGAAGSLSVSTLDDSPYLKKEAMAAILLALGLTETMNYSFLSKDLLDLFGTGSSDRRVYLPNPVSADHTVMRDSLIPQMALSLGYNLSRQVADVGCFELGRVYSKNEAGEPSEEERVAIGMIGQFFLEKGMMPCAVSSEEAFRRIKGVLESLFESCGCASPRVQPEKIEFMEAGFAAGIYADDQRIGLVGLLNESVKKEWRMTGPVAIAEIATLSLIKYFGRVPKAAQITAYPSVSRDMALTVPESMTYDTIVGTIRKHAPEELTDIKLFDIFKGKGIPEGMKSMAFTLIFRSAQKTLTDVEVNDYHSAVKKALKSDLEIDIRES